MLHRRCFSFLCRAGLVVSVLRIAVSAAATDVRILTLPAAIAEALATNPDIQAAGFRTTAATARIPQAKALDDPMIGVEFYNMPRTTFDVGRSEDVDYTVQQNLPFPGKRHTRGVTARFDADAVAATERGKIRDVILEVKNTYYELYRLERSAQVNRDNQQLFRQLLQSATTAYATAHVAVDAPLKAQVELSKLQNEAITLQQEHTTHLAHLQALLGRSYHDEIRLPATLPWPHLTASLETLRDLAQTSRPEIQVAHALQHESQSRVTEAQQKLLPDFSFGLAYKQKPALPDVWAAHATMTLPVFFWKQRAAISEAHALQHAAVAEQRSVAQHTQHEIAQAYAGVLATEKILAQFRRGILPQVKVTLDSAHTAYASGTVDFLTVVDAARTYKDLQMSFYETQARFGMAFAALERLVGRDLEGNPR